MSYEPSQTPRPYKKPPQKPQQASGEASDPAAVEITDYVKENGLEKALLKYSNITDADDVKMIRTFYNLFVSKAPFTRFVETLAEMKSVNAH